MISSSHTVYLFMYLLLRTECDAVKKKKVFPYIIDMILWLRLKILVALGPGILHAIH